MASKIPINQLPPGSFLTGSEQVAVVQNNTTVQVPTSYFLPGTNTAFSRYAFIATAGQTNFGLPYTPGLLSVYQNGLLLATSRYTATNSTAIVLNTAASAGDDIEIFTFLNTASVGSMYTDFSNATGINAVNHGGTGTSTSTGTGSVVLSNAPSLVSPNITSGIVLKGATSQTVTLQTQSVAGNYTLTLPSTAGSLNYALVTDGSGNLSWSPAGGTVSSVQVSGGTTGLTTSGGPIVGSGTITLAGTLNVANGGTGVATSSGASSVVLRDSNANITANAFYAASGDLVLGTTTANGIHFVVNNGAPDAAAIDSSKNFTALVTAPGTGATQRTLKAKLNDIVSVLDFGADPTGAADCTTAFNNAIAATGGNVFVPPGTYKISGTITISKPISITGAGVGVTIISTSSATADLFVMNAAYQMISSMSFTSSATRTAGAYINISANCSNSRVRDFYMDKQYTGILGSNINSIWVDTGTIYNTAVNGFGIQLTGGGNDIYLNKITMSGVSNVATAGINLINVGAVNITDCDIIRHGTDLLINPGAGQVVTSIYVENTYFDTATNGVVIAPTNAGGTVQGLRFVGCWTSAHSNVGFTVGSVGSIFGVECVSLYAFSNTANGILLSGGSDIRFLGGASCGSSAGSGATIAANVSSFSFIGMRLGNGYGKPANAGNGIYIAAGTSGNFSIIGCDLTGNTGSALTDNGTGANKNIYGNTGIDPGATSTISVTASPFTYTAGDRPETIYINGGTVSLVNVDGLNVFQSSNVTIRLGSGKSVVVTYTGLPGMAKTVE